MPNCPIQELTGRHSKHDSDIPVSVRLSQGFFRYPWPLWGMPSWFALNLSSAPYDLLLGHAARSTFALETAGALVTERRDALDIGAGVNADFGWPLRRRVGGEKQCVEDVKRGATHPLCLQKASTTAKERVFRAAQACASDPI